MPYALAPYGGGFLVTDGHHNRVLQVTLGGAITEVATFANVVPTGLEVRGRSGLGRAGRPGPPPRRDRTGPRAGPCAPSRESSRRAPACSSTWSADRGTELYALSQGVWDGVMEGSPALPDTGRLTRVTSGGGLEPVTDSAGHELVLDRPTSVEFVGRTAYVVSLSGDVSTIDGL